MGTQGQSQKIIKLEDYDAVLFDLDGVLTETSKIHAASWKKMFDVFLQKHAKENSIVFKPFDIGSDYKLYVDGKLRDEGVRSFLESRNIKMPHGALNDSPGHDTVCSLANMKYEIVQSVLETDGVEAYEGSVRLVRYLRDKGVKIAVVSSSKSCRTVLKAAGIIDMFEKIVDGETAASLKLPGKPAPDTYLKAAEMLGVTSGCTVIVEDAISGVQAGRNGRFGLVVGVAREGNSATLKEHGADIVVEDLAELIP